MSASPAREETDEERRALRKMRYPPICYWLARETGQDVRDVARWPLRLIEAWSAYLDWDTIQTARAREEAEVEARLAQKRREQKQACGQNPPRPTLGTVR